MPLFNLFKTPSKEAETKTKAKGLGTVEVNAFNLPGIQSSTTNTYSVSSPSSLSSLAEVKNPLALRVVNKMASYVIGSGYNVEFNNPQTDEKYEAWAQRHQVKHSILEGVRQSLAMPRGCLVYLVGGLINKPITRLEGINLVNTARVELLPPDEAQIFNSGYGKTVVKARVSGGQKVIDPTRYAIIDLSSNTSSSISSSAYSSTQSFVERILPASEIMVGLLEKAELVLDQEGAIIYKSTTHNQEVDDKKVQGYAERMALIKNHMKQGTLALIPQLDEIINFSRSSSLSSLLPAMKDIYSAITGVPKSILFGEMQSGINTGAGKERDHENFMRDMRGYQESSIRPLLEKIVRVFTVEEKIANPEYSISFSEPEPMNEREKVELNKLHNDGIVSLVTAGLLDESEARENIRGMKVV